MSTFRSSDGGLPPTSGGSTGVLDPHEHHWFAEPTKRVGPKFDLKLVHNVVLTHGALPLSVLERVIEDWITRRGQA